MSEITDRICLTCGYVGSEACLRTNHMCPKCHKGFPLGRPKPLGTFT